MGFFDKKFCDICGDKIGLLGNRKLEDGNCCKDCAKKLSPWFDERRHSTVEQIKQQLAYREENQKAVDAFRVTRTYGEGLTVLHVDEGARKFMISSARNYSDGNPDVLDFSQVTDVQLKVRDSRRELKQKDAEGKEVSFNPPRYEYEYDFDIYIRVKHPWFDEMHFRFNREELVIQDIGAVRTGVFTRQNSFDPTRCADYQNYEGMAREVINFLMGRSQASRGVAASGTGAGAGVVLDLYTQAMQALDAGQQEQAIRLFQEEIEQGGDDYVGLLLEMQKKVMEPTSSVEDVQGLLNWANRAKAAGCAEADTFIHFAAMTLRARENGVGAEAPLAEQMASAISAMHAEAMASRAANSGVMPANGSWMCVCGAQNTGKFCEYCGSPRP